MKQHGIWVPPEIWGLFIGVEHRILLSQINYYDDREGEFIGTNKYMADELNCSVGKITKIIKELEAEKYITIQNKTTCPPMWKNETPITKRVINVNRDSLLMPLRRE